MFQKRYFRELTELDINFEYLIYKDSIAIYLIVIKPLLILLRDRFFTIIFCIFCTPCIS